MANWPYNMTQMISLLAPPVTEPATNVTGIACGPYVSGNRTCSGQGVKIGTLPSPWPPPPNTPTLNNVPRYVYANVGSGGLLKLTGASSGSGLLVIDGDAEFEAGFQWYGLIVVRGVVKFLGGGSNTNIYGAVLAGTSVTNVSAMTSTGGSVNIVYNSCAFRYNNQSQPLRFLSFREIQQ